MPTIKFSDKELEYLRSSYQAELKATMKYIEEIRRIVAKLGGTAKSQLITAIASKPDTKKSKKRGRPKKNEIIFSKTKESKPVTKRKPGRPPKVKIEAEKKKEVASSDNNIKAPSKKTKKRRGKSKSRWSGITLANLSKPLKVKSSEERKENSPIQNMETPSGL
jgi:hypothetical protein